jgi:hypothetical protein
VDQASWRDQRRSVEAGVTRSQALCSMRLGDVDKFGWNYTKGTLVILFCYANCKHENTISVNKI